MGHVSAIEEQLRVAELREKEIQERYDRLLLEKDEKLTLKKQELQQASSQCSEFQQTAQDSLRY